ncbi:PAS domain S-box protein [Haliangium ochraceum]|uniref:histidine kinase n=1 Tax=Haliangium ochraceum (strain DSM 14365 / JCM 11303 / SMP-2) TaxID=502025 RepID=D0LTT6_HALO1|nr:PAS domain S-box protein [Haliangium ochraceum]ACY15780.1 signal transduction histidine kinase with CheB and CheR activity [Haliangium ochraceum DSM 14365]
MNDSADGTESGRSPVLAVGVGASAESAQTFEELLRALPLDTGMALFLVQYMEPDDGAELHTALAESTGHRVIAPEHGARVEANTVYLMQAGTELTIEGGRLDVGDPVLHRGMHRPINRLFRSLARGFAGRAVGIVLSGVGRDGTAGLREIHAQGGLSIAQEPETAAQGAMPRSAIDSGVVDLVLPIAEMAGALEQFAATPYLRGAGDEVEDAAADPAGGARTTMTLPPEVLEQVTEILGPSLTMDVAHYKSATVERRTVRRMGLAGFQEIEPYLEHLRANEEERELLVRDLLINVTRFFRDGDAFELLSGVVIADIINSAGAQDTVRVWVPGCATGEEAYSIAIAFLDAMSSQSKRLTLQLFATDVDEEALAVARAGLYGPEIADQVSEEHLERYFTRVNGRGYRVRPRLRDALSFAVHDLCGDPPFSRMDLISCRNLLIYLRQQAQEDVLRALHFALEPTGYLFLGASESVGALRELFTTLSKPWRLFQRAGAARPLLMRRGRSTGRLPRIAQRPPVDEVDIASAARDAMLAVRVPPSVAVSHEGRVLYVHGDIGAYLHYPKGEPRLDLLADLRADLVTRVRAALYKCRRDGVTVEALSTPERGGGPGTRITASPAPQLGEGAAVLSFEQVAGVEPADDTVPVETPEQENLIEQLERELNATREDLRNTVEELESANEELRTSHEESMSMNEELQSANEELEAMTEELRSLNEELATINRQLKDKIGQLEKTHDDLSNFFASTKLATLFLDDERRIKRFTPAAAEFLQLDEEDEGRRIDDIARPLLHMDLDDDVAAVLDELIPRTRELQTPDGRWFVRRVLPYRTEARRIEGVVATWTDITELKRTAAQLEVRERMQGVIARLGFKALGEDQDVLLAQVVREVQQTLATDLCGILTLDSEHSELMLEVGVGWNQGAVQSSRVPLGMDSQAGYTLAAGEPVAVENLAEERRFKGSALMREHDVVSGVSCAIQDGDAAYGVLCAHTREPRAFENDEVHFLQSVASLLAVAISHRQTRQRLAIERGVGQALAQSTSLDEAMPQIVGVFTRELDMDGGELWMVDEDGATLARRAFVMPEPYRSSEAAARREGSLIRRGVGLVGRVWERGHAEWLSVLSEEQTLGGDELHELMGLRCGCALPILLGTEVIGAVSLFTRRRRLVDRQLVHSLDAIGTTIGEFVRRSEAESATRLSEMRLRMAIDAAAAVVFESDVGARQVRSLFGSEALLGEVVEAPLSLDTWMERVHPDDVARLEQELSEIVHGTRQLQVLEYRLRHRDGRYLHVEVHARDTVGADGVTRRNGVILNVHARKQAEAELADRERRMRLAVGALDAGVFAHAEPVGEELYLSARWLGMLGLAPSALPPAPRFYDWLQAELIHEDDVASFANARAAFVAGHTGKLDLELRLRHAEGHWMWGRMVADAVARDDEGRLLRLTGLLWDVTAAKEAERRLRESEENFRRLAESIPHMVWTARPSGGLDYCNQRALELLGRSQAELSQPDAWLEAIHPSERAAVTAAWHEAMSLGREFRADLRLRDASCGAYRWHSVHAVPAHGDGDRDAPAGERTGARVLRWFGTFTNIHERKAFEDRLSESEQRLQRTFEGSPLGIVFLQRDGRMKRLNPALMRLLGLSDEDVARGLTWLDLIPAERASLYDEAMAQLERTGRVGPAERVLVAKSGRHIPALSSSFQIGQGDEFVTFIVDLTEQKQAAAERAKLAAIVESSDDAILSQSLDGRIESWNRGAERLYGYAADEAIGRPVEILIPATHGDENDRLLAGVSAGDTVVQHETMRLRKSGAEVPVSITMSAIIDEMGACVGISMVTRDITEQKRAEARLRESEDRYRENAAEMEAVYATLPVGLGLSDRQHTFLRANERLLELLELESARVCDSAIETLLPALAVHVAPLIDQIFESGEPILNREFRAASGGGVERHWLSSFAPVFDTDEQVRAVSWMVQDVTERTEAETRLRESEWRFRQVLVNSPLPMMMYDDAGRVLALSEAWTATTGYQLDDMPSIGRWAELAYRDEAGDVLTYLGSLWSSEASGEHIELRVFAKDGEERTILFSGAPLGTSPDGRRLRLWAGTDLTERKQAEEALREASAQKDQFLAMLGHELRNPLAAIRGAAELLLLSDGGGDELERTRGIIERQSAHMAKLIDGLLDVSRVVLGKIVLDSKVVDVVEILRDLMQDHADRIERSGLSLRLDLPGEPIWIDGDRVRLTQIFGNLLANALQFTSAPGTITISAETIGSSPAGTALVRVRDTGAGIAPELLPHVFEPFRQAAQNIDRAAGGLGLGLALVRGLVELHGGHIEASSGGAERGAQFTLHLPLAQRAREPVREEPALLGPRRLLVVEDNPDMAELLRDMLTRSGHQVAVAHNGMQALDVARKVEPDFILCDIGLPGGMSGYDLARAIRKDDKLGDVQLVALTGYGRPEDRAEAEAVGFDTHLTKPVSMSAIQELLARGTGRHRA